jgi:hypothetical protein
MSLAQFTPILRQLADEHLDSMASVPWADMARSIRNQKFPDLPVGGNFGCTIEGRYYDVGDYVMWENQPNGDIRLVSYATTYESPDDQTGLRFECKRIIKVGMNDRPMTKLDERLHSVGYILAAIGWGAWLVGVGGPLLAWLTDTPIYNRNTGTMESPPSVPIVLFAAGSAIVGTVLIRIGYVIRRAYRNGRRSGF